MGSLRLTYKNEDDSGGWVGTRGRLQIVTVEGRRDGRSLFNSRLSHPLQNTIRGPVSPLGVDDSNPHTLLDCKWFCVY